jgi:iron complex transport system substrate-binding protein
MTRFTPGAFLFALAAWLACLPSFAAPAQRIASLAPSLTELVYAAGAGDKLVAVSAYSDFPAAARALPMVADAAGISFESLLAQRPDLVLAWKSGTRESDVARLQSAGIKVLAIEVRKLVDIADAIRVIGRASGTSVAADLAAEKVDAELARLRHQSAGLSRVKVFFELSAQPLMTVNGEHFISEAIALCGGENAFADLSPLVATPSREALLARGAEVIFYARSPSSSRPFDTESYRGLDAIRTGQAYALTADYVMRPGPRLLLAVNEICQSLGRVRAAKAATGK